jgi:hypothetical protein
MIVSKSISNKEIEVKGHDLGILDMKLRTFLMIGSVGTGEGHLEQLEIGHEQLELLEGL